MWGTPLHTTPLLPWRTGDRRLGGHRPLLMGILNVTPDSFFDGGRYHTLDKARRHCEQLITSGADIIDVGGESTRPGSRGVTVEEELSRVIDVIKNIRKDFDVPVSIDTTKSEVARAAVEEGAEIINDVTGMTKDSRMPETASACGAGIVLGHIKGTPEDMQERPEYGDVMAEVKDFLKGQIESLCALGISRDRIAVDPGIGFGKTLKHNYTLMARMEELGELGCPILMGMSRKSFIAKTRGLEHSDRLFPSTASAALAALKGCSVLRVHDVKETWEQLRLIEAVLNEE